MSLSELFTAHLRVPTRAARDLVPALERAGLEIEARAYEAWCAGKSDVPSLGAWFGKRMAIAAAIAEAGRDDIVLIAGKGHEQGQIVGSGDTLRVLPFDDVTVARECAAAEGA